MNKVLFVCLTTWPCSILAAGGGCIVRSATARLWGGRVYVGKHGAENSLLPLVSINIALSYGR
jgi:hypothetical protein